MLAAGLVLALMLSLAAVLLYDRAGVSIRDVARLAHVRLRSIGGGSHEAGPLISGVGSDFVCGWG
ncbi:Uncharacterised protein [Mycobacteroides abscessus subsp. abscessus]|nr:Uncharacterised protein [Mycobacteroides abscessus subsp. abscessus]